MKLSMKKKMLPLGKIGDVPEWNRMDHHQAICKGLGGGDSEALSSCQISDRIPLEF